ncbi:MAG: succinate dehydrogenase cytochrome b subunit [Bacteroidota bacterium]|nr:succinate dehydrogenase cytochrome b subunit [Bacteroidota bacterium]MDX5404650.1 succinate dehydrogenase cytochrome b subunit [Bacteroidota bacterium]MDX5426480.1 succinate dehydrogenase cytochrome b subunit [Bacteroidota bacterium]MDX5448094.1 succinate dehydrogenase cytochrome b subunit [Bacteroidota bacterium]MDX5504507.1 succinate dehydrogenase cytochrome b subunit [Bacteroidota bacterium]
MASTATGLFGSSLVRKYWMAATGLFLCLFLIGHLAGNLQLFIPGEEGQLQFNAYAKFMTSNPAVKILSYLTYFSILLHAIDGIVLARQNKAARPVNYVKNSPEKNSSWASRSMVLLGIITLIFILIHMRSFWFEMHWGGLDTDANGNKDLYTITVAAFQTWWYTAFYVLAMIALAFHLSHGFSSAFQSMGWNHPKYMPVIKKIGVGFAVIIPLLFAAIPVYLFIK